MIEASLQDILTEPLSLYPNPILPDHDHNKIDKEDSTDSDEEVTDIDI